MNFEFITDNLNFNSYGKNNSISLNQTEIFNSKES